MRTYYPTPGDQPLSILPYKRGRLAESYIPPALVQVTGSCGASAGGPQQGC